MKIVKTYEKPTDIYIIGTDFKEQQEAFSLTDDYMSLTIKGTNGTICLDTDACPISEKLMTVSELIDSL